jgi:hypothetical protein
MKNYHKNQRGFSHHFILPLLAFVAVGAIGAYVIAKSNAATIMSKDIVYSVFPKDGGNDEDFKFYHYTPTGTTEYPANVTNVIDSSVDRKWMLGYTTGNQLVAYSNGGQTISYNYSTDTLFGGNDCSSDGFYVRGAAFMKTIGTTAPSIYFIGVSIPCENGVYANKVTFGLYTSDVNGSMKKIFSQSGSYESGRGGYGRIESVATNGNILVIFTNSKDDFDQYVMSQAGKIIYKVPSTISGGEIYLSDNGKKIAYEKSSNIYAANSDGKKSKKVMSTSGNEKFLSGISPTGSYIVYQKLSSKDKYSLYSYKISSKKSQLLDSGSWDTSIKQNPIWEMHWLPGQDTIYYRKQAAETKKVEIKQVSVIGKGKKTIFSSPFSANTSVELF